MGSSLGVKTPDGNVWLAIRKASIDIGLSSGQADNEVKKIKASLLFKGEWTELSVKYEGQVRTTLVLSEKFVSMWLAQINLTPSMREKHPEAVKKLLKYQLKAAKDRISFLLGGAHSLEYKNKSKSYFINLWNNFKEKYSTGSYKDLNPIYYDEAFNFISTWNYVEY